MVDNETESNNEERDLQNMFPIVWVKVEREEDNSEAWNEKCENLDNTEPQADMEKETTDIEKSTHKNIKQKSPPKPKNLICGQCDYRTAHKGCLKYHSLNHTNPKPLACDVCEYTTKYPTSLQRHIITQHQPKEDLSELPTYKCTECPYTSIFKWNLASHKQKHKLNKAFKCDQCDFSSVYKHHFIKHAKVHREKPEVQYQCDKCPFTTKFEGHMTRHLAVLHNEVSNKASKCEKCNFSTKVGWRLNVHRNRSRQDRPLNCNFCDFVTSYMCEFRIHKAQHRRQTNKVDTSICSANNIGAENESMNSSEYGDGEENNTDSLQSKDGNINLYLVDKDCEVELRSIQVTELPGQEMPFQCTTCSYKSKFKASVQRHYLRQHTDSNNKPYKCVNCDYSTKTKDKISLHTKRSKSDSIVQCNSCNFSTYFKCQLVMHQKCHYLNKCKFCSYTCKSSYDMQRHHSTVHLGNGMKCQYCEFKAASRESLLCHETLHTGVKPFKCGLCDFSTRRRCLLDNHVKTYHGTEPVIIDDGKIESLKVNEKLP